MLRAALITAPSLTLRTCSAGVCGVRFYNLNQWEIANKYIVKRKIEVSRRSVRFDIFPDSDPTYD